MVHFGAHYFRKQLACIADIVYLLFPLVLYYKGLLHEKFFVSLFLTCCLTLILCDPFRAAKDGTPKTEIVVMKVKSRDISQTGTIHLQNPLLQYIIKLISLVKGIRHFYAVA